MNDAAGRIASRYLKAMRLPDPVRMTAEDAVEVADGIRADLEDRVRALVVDVHNEMEHLQNVQRAFSREDWQALEEEGVMTREELNFILKFKAEHDSDWR